MPKIDYSQRGKKSSTKKKSKRSKNKYPALDPHLNLITRQEQIDYDYLDKLSPTELEFLNKFSSETINASVDAKKRKNNLYAKTKEKVKECFDSNNSRNRDILTRQKAMHMIRDLEDIKEVTANPEDQLNARIDLQLLGVIDRDGELLIPIHDILDTPLPEKKQNKRLKKSI